SADASMQPISAYVAALNQMLQTGDSTEVDSVLSEDFVEQGPASVFGSDRTGFERYLRALSATYPGLRVTLEDSLANGTRVSLRLTYQGQRVEKFLGRSLAPTLSTWTTVDLFRVEGGRVAEHWASDSGIELFQPLVTDQARARIDGADVIAIARMHPVGSVMLPITLPGAAIVIVENGALTARADAPWRVVPAANHMPNAIAAGHEAVLHAGDAAVLPANAPVIQAVDPQSSFIVVAAIPPQAVIDAASFVTNPILDALRSPRGAEPVIAAGVAVERLALVNPRTALSNTIAIGLSRVVLPPGAELDLSGIHGIAAVAVETGRADVAPNDGRLMIQPIEHPSEESPATRLGEPVLLRGGDAAVVPVDANAQVRNASGDSALLLIVTVAPEDTPSISADTDTPAPPAPTSEDPRESPR
ncbi:MAG TPA: ester cyclase, partial [Thermomicrobiales bacterium]|nr:ester cyclase [Thermomicrobiales bacterium]